MGEDELELGKPQLSVDGKMVSYADKPLKVDGGTVIGADGGWNEGVNSDKEQSMSANIKVRTCDVVGFLWRMCKEEAHYWGQKFADVVRLNVFTKRIPRKSKKKWKKKTAKALYENYAVLNSKHILKYIKAKRK